MFLAEGSCGPDGTKGGGSAVSAKTAAAESGKTFAPLGTQLGHGEGPFETELIFKQNQTTWKRSYYEEEAAETAQRHLEYEAKREAKAKAKIEAEREAAGSRRSQRSSKEQKPSKGTWGSGTNSRRPRRRDPSAGSSLERRSSAAFERRNSQEAQRPMQERRGSVGS